MKPFATLRPALLVLALLPVFFSNCTDNGDLPLVDRRDDGKLFLSSSTMGAVGVLDINDSRPVLATFPAASTDAHGIYYLDERETILQVNRDESTLVSYQNVLSHMEASAGVTVAAASTPDFVNGRGLTHLGGDRFVVVQDDRNDRDRLEENSMVVYRYTSDQGFVRQRKVYTGFDLWGLRNGDRHLFASVDNTDSLAVFDRTVFSAPDETRVGPDHFIKIAGIKRTCGIAYNLQNDVLVLTDVGSLDSYEDGAVVIIPNFTSLMNVDTITAADYLRISGPETALGNPVDVAYDRKQQRVYVAEQANEGGQLLVFDATVGGDSAPISRTAFPGISALFLNRD